ncbi:PE domain-containing protein [Saccharothrix longispora]|uniref:PE domain-containing protein n=1 Tax=Saccharothrix longispora TaxID=33920 RepID=UPI0028FDC37B|nr:PE domain-containing protein [Saccharothrix longispora]MBY8850775.1 PE domain-containing protein [Saccharothrix sp. MB29]MDU0289072.1 PE domain-containing protein [Saccharothrix longispora]
MPFMASGGGAGAPAPAGPVTMQVEPGQILALKARYEAVRDTLQDFLDSQRENLRGRPVAEDDVSRDAANVFAKNAATVIDVTTKFIVELTLSIDQFDQAAKTYNLVEDVNTATMQQDRGL